MLAAGSIGADMIELILTMEPGAAFLPSLWDTGITYLSGVFTGDNYVGFGGISRPPTSLPQDMYSVNQDFVVNLGEAAFPVVLAGTLGVSGIIAEAATVPIPGDIIIYESGALLAYQITDAITSSASALYDAGRYDGSIQNHITVGISPNEGVILVYWP